MSDIPNEKELKRISKFISLVLRHQPETIGLVLDGNGRADVHDLLEKMNTSGTAITQDMLETIVATNNKKRFSFSDDHNKIRANQGHSVDVDLELEAVVPPEYLYHGTAEQNISSVLATGLEKRSRQHVHLSADTETATAVGMRHGKPVIFTIAAKKCAMTDFNSIFLQTAYGLQITCRRSI